MRRSAGLGLVLSVVLALGAEAARAHEIPGLDAVFIQGMFQPAYTPPAPELRAAGDQARAELRPAGHDRAFGRHAGADQRPDRGRQLHLHGVFRPPGLSAGQRALRELQENPAEGLVEQALLLSISFDPERDHPEHLAKYAKRFDADPTAWRFLTARSGRGIQAVLDAYGQDRTPVLDDRGRFTGLYRHVLKVFLVDAAGDVRNVYSAGFLVPSWCSTISAPSWGWAIDVKRVDTVVVHSHAEGTMDTGRTFSLIGSLLLLVATLAGPAEAQAPAARTQWKMQSSWPATDFHQVNPKGLVEKIGEMTGGRLTVDLQAAGTVVPALKVLDAVNRGLLDAEPLVARILDWQAPGRRALRQRARRPVRDELRGLPRVDLPRRRARAP